MNNYMISFSSFLNKAKVNYDGCGIWQSSSLIRDTGSKSKKLKKEQLCNTGSKSKKLKKERHCGGEYISPVKLLPALIGPI